MCVFAPSQSKMIKYVLAFSPTKIESNKKKRPIDKYVLKKIVFELAAFWEIPLQII